MIIKTEKDIETGETIITFPDEIVKEFNLKEGDICNLEQLEKWNYFYKF